MYEPYGEEKKDFNFKEKFNELKQKIQEKFKNLNTENLKFDKVTLTVVALALLLGIGGITGFISYTGRINTLQSENIVLEKQNDALQTQVDNISQQLETCNYDLEYSKADLDEVKAQLTKMTLDYQSSQTNLQTCNNEKVDLSSDLNLVNEELDKKESEYNSLKDDYDDLEDKVDEITCNYARDVCKDSKFSMNYYFVDGNEVFCCSEMDIDSCFGQEPESSDDIKEITC